LAWPLWPRWLCPRTRAAFEDNGGQVIQKLWVPLNVQDYAPYLAQVKKDADAVFVLALGRWTLLFAKQWATSGLKDKMALIAGGTYSDEHVLPELGDGGRASRCGSRAAGKGIPQAALDTGQRSDGLTTEEREELRRLRRENRTLREEREILL
jgi:hypothetical protein